MRAHKSIFVLSFLLAFSLAIAMAQATKPGPPSTEPGSSASPKGTMNDNAALKQPSRTVQSQIQEELFKNNLNNVTVNVSPRRIDLGGMVATKSEHDQALQIARYIGQQNRQVVDHITIGQSR